MEKILYGIDNDVYYFTSSKEKKGTSRWSSHICYSGICGYHEEVCYKYITLRYFVTPDLGKRMATKYLVNVLRELPAHMKASVLIVRDLKKQHYRGEKSEGGPIPVHWVDIRVDTSLICSDELYAMLCLFRMPQETPGVVYTTFEVMKAFPEFTFSHAFAVASAETQHSGHCIITECSWCVHVPQDWPNFSIKERLGHLKCADSHYKTNTFSRTVNQKFWFGRSVGWNCFNGDMVSVRGLPRKTSYALHLLGIKK